MVSDDHRKKPESAAIRTDADRLPAPPQSGRRIPMTAEMLLGAAVLAWFIGYVFFLILTASAHNGEAQINQLPAARGDR